jgi:hypothetical protein
MWPFGRKRRESMTESQKAVKEATQSLKRVQERDPEVRAVSKTLKDIRERNHFAEQLKIIMEGG